MSINPNNVNGITIPGPLTATANQSALTGMCWFNLFALPTTPGNALFDWTTGAILTGSRFGLNTSSSVPNKLRCVAKCTDTDVLSSFDSTNNVLTPGLWQHAAFTIDYVAQTPLLYVNGVNQPVAGVSSLTGTATSNTSSAAAKIGGDINNTVFVNGLIEDVRLYQRALSVQEIMTIFTAQGMDGIVQGLASRYVCNDLANGQPVAGISSIGPIDRVTGVPVNGNAINFGTTYTTPRKRSRVMHSG
jgi:Concanavalin A-like lectin/glucanases superfamily